MSFSSASTVVALSQRERNAVAFASVMPEAQEANVNAPHQPRDAFREAVSQAQEDQESAGRLNAARYRASGGKATHTKNTFRVIPSKSDFVADIYITARRVLSKEAFKYFTRFYLCPKVAGIYPLGIANMNNPLDKTSTGEDKFLAAHLDRYEPSMRREVREFDQSLRETLGEAFIANGIYPVPSYYNRDRADVRYKWDI